MAAPAPAPAADLRVVDGRNVRLFNHGCAAAAGAVFTIRVPCEDHLRRTLPAASLAAMGQIVNFSVYGNTQKHLRILGGGKVDCDGGNGHWATFEICHPLANSVALRSCGPHQPRAQYLAGVRQGDGTVGIAASTDPNAPGSRWALLEPGADEHIPQAFDHKVDLSPGDYEFFAREGYLICRGAVSRRLTDAALRCINHLIGTGPAAWVAQPARKGPTDQTNMVLANSSHPAILALHENSSIKTLSQRLLGEGNVRPCTNGQLAVRFPAADVLENPDGTLTPQAARLSASNTGAANFHIDGQGTGHAIPFSLQCLVALTDQDVEGSGNFTVFPRSHRNRAMIQWYHTQQADRARPDLGPPLQVCVKAGDCVLVHPLLAHRGGTNLSPHPRYSVIFRIQHRAWEEMAKGAGCCERLQANPLCFLPPVAGCRFPDDPPAAGGSGGGGPQPPASHQYQYPPPAQHALPVVPASAPAPAAPAGGVGGGYFAPPPAAAHPPHPPPGPAAAYPAPPQAPQGYGYPPPQPAANPYYQPPPQGQPHGGYPVAPAPAQPQHAPVGGGGGGGVAPPGAGMMKNFSKLFKK